MSAAMPLTTRLGRFSYDVFERSGRVPASFAAESLATMSLEPVEVLTSTWMSGFCAFQTSTIFPMFGAQDQYRRITGPSAGFLRERAPRILR